MYVADMSLEEARDWLEELEHSRFTEGHRMTSAEKEQIGWDIEDLRGRIKELEA